MADDIKVPEGTDAPVDATKSLEERIAEQQKVLDKLTKENEATRKNNSELKKKNEELSALDTKVKQYEEKIKTIEETDLKAKEQFKDLFEKAKAEAEAIKKEKSDIEIKLKESEVFIEGVKKKDAEHRESLIKNIKEISEKIKDESIMTVAEAMPNNETLEIYFNQLRNQKTEKISTYDGKVVTGGSGELMTAQNANREVLDRMREDNPTLYDANMKNILATSKLRPSNR